MGDGRALLHTYRVAAENLGGGGVLPLPQLEQGNRLFILVAQGLGADHLSTGQARPLLPADGAEGHVGDPGHGGQSQGRFNVDSSDGYHASSYGQGPEILPGPNCFTPFYHTLYWLTRAAEIIKIVKNPHKEREAWNLPCVPPPWAA